MKIRTEWKYAVVAFALLGMFVATGIAARRADAQAQPLGTLPARVQLWSLMQNGGVPPGYGFPNILGQYRNTWAVYKLDSSGGQHLVAAAYNDDGLNDCNVLSNNGWSIQCTATTAYPSPQNGSNGNQYATVSAFPTTATNGIYVVQFNDFYSTTCPAVIGGPQGPSDTGVQFQSVSFVLYNGAYWPLNEGSGQNFPIYDTSGNNNNATMYPAASQLTAWVTSRGAFAAALGGSNNTYIAANNTTCGNVAQSDFTVSAWVNTVGTGMQCVLSKRPASGFGWYEVWLANGVVHAELFDTNGTTSCVVTSGTLLVNDGNWHMVTATRSTTTSSALNLYVDGVKVASATTPSAINLINSSAVTLGTDAFNNRLTGYLDDVLITYHALSATDITNQYYAPIAYWNLNEGTGTTAFDDMMNENDMQVPGTTPPASFWYPVGGKFGGAFDFTGVAGSSVTNILNNPVGHPSALGDFNTGDFTASCWVKPVSTSGLQDILMKEHSTSPSQMFGMWLNNGVVHAAISNSTGSAYGEATSGTYTLSTTQWHMVTMTRSAGVVTLYVNDLNGQGVAQQQSWTSGNVGAVNVDNGGQMTMGENMYTGQFGSPTNFLNGFADDARVFAFKLDAKQVTNLYNTQLAGTP